MLRKYNKTPLLLIFCVLLLGSLSVAIPAIPQNPSKGEEEDPEKKVRRDYRGENKNQSNEASDKKTIGPSNKPTLPTSKKARVNRKLVKEEKRSSEARASIGVTLWRVENKELKEEPTKSVRYHAAKVGNTKMVAERVGLKTELTVEDKIRLTIEVPFDGYLYIVDQERYSENGAPKVGEPVLIFPDMRIREGRNDVRRRLLTGIPSDKDDPPYFNLEPLNSKGSTLLEDIITIIVTEEPIKELPAREGAYRVPGEVFNKLRGATKSVRKIIEGKKREIYTQAEKEAEMGEIEKGLNYEGDPLPDNVYEVEYDSNIGFAVSIPLVVSQVKGAKAD